MDKQYANDLLDEQSRAGSQPTVEASQGDAKKSGQVKGEYTSRIIGWILRGGVILSATMILIGLMLLLLHSGGIGGPGVSLGTFPHTLSQVWSGLLKLQPLAMIVLGLLFLIATPIITVITSMVAFAVERDRRYVVIALIVLAILIASLLIGKGGG